MGFFFPTEWFQLFLWAISSLGIGFDFPFWGEAEVEVELNKFSKFNFSFKFNDRIFTTLMR
jgi:hypothetical protein